MTVPPLYTKPQNAEVTDKERLTTYEIYENDKRMKLYTSTGTVKLRKMCNDLDVGLLMVDHWRDPKEWSYFAVDNGCYSAFSRKVEWNPTKFLNILYKCKALGLTPDFIVIPDIVGGGLDSLKKSETWGPFLEKEFGFPMYLAVQDGMKVEDVYNSSLLWIIHGIFIGGTMKWKIAHMKEWVDFAHDEKLKCHVGRIGTFSRMKMTKIVGADSIDSTSWVQNTGWMETRVARFRNQRHKDCTLDNLENVWSTGEAE